MGALVIYLLLFIPLIFAKFLNSPLGIILFILPYTWSLARHNKGSENPVKSFYWKLPGLASFIIFFIITFNWYQYYILNVYQIPVFSTDHPFFWTFQFWGGANQYGRIWLIFYGTAIILQYLFWLNQRITLNVRKSTSIWRKISHTSAIISFILVILSVGGFFMHISERRNAESEWRWRQRVAHIDIRQFGMDNYEYPRAYGSWIENPDPGTFYSGTTLGFATIDSQRKVFEHYEELGTAHNMEVYRSIVNNDAGNDADALILISNGRTMVVTRHNSIINGWVMALSPGELSLDSLSGMGYRIEDG